VSVLPRVSGREVVKALARVGYEEIDSEAVISFSGETRILTAALPFRIIRK